MTSKEGIKTAGRVPKVAIWTQLVLAALVLLGAGCNGSPDPDPRALPGSDVGVSLEESLRDLDLIIPECALHDVLFLRPPRGLLDEAGVLYLRLKVDDECLSGTLRALMVDDSDFLGAESLWWWASPPSPASSEPLEWRSAGAIHPATKSRGDLQVKVAILESGLDRYLYVRATL